MPTQLNILIAEDSETDLELIMGELRRSGYEPRWKQVETEAAFLEELKKEPDLILSDYAMPQFSGLRAAELTQDSGLNIPLILISGTVGEDAAVEAMKLGVADYFLKDRLARLGKSVENVLEKKRLRDQQKQAVEEIRSQLEELQRWQEATLGREERIMELKQEVNELLTQLKQPPRYSSPNEI